MKYSAFSPETEITGAILQVMYSYNFPYASPSVAEIMSAHNLNDPQPDKWYKQQDFMNCIETIEEKLGHEAVENTAFQMLYNFHALPVIDLEADLIYGDTGYQMCHRNGEIGYFELIDFNEIQRTAIMEIQTAYPTQFIKGLIKSVVIKHVPEGTFAVEPNDTQQTESADKRIFKITWEVKEAGN